MQANLPPQRDQVALIITRMASVIGLLVAIMALLPFNYLNARMEEARAELEEAGNRLEILLVRGGVRSGE